MRFLFLVSLSVGLLLLTSCSGDVPGGSSPTLFEKKPSERTGVTFTNTLSESAELNILNYHYYYDGGGVAVGDVNGNGLRDLYFTSNEGDNHLYLNRGDFRFDEVTKAAGVAGLADWSTGVIMADVTGNGLLDIYVSAVHGIHGLEGHNELYVNQGTDEDGIPQFEEKAADYGLDFRGYATQAAFFDYDLDGDLDVYLLNHSLHEEQTHGPVELRYERHPRAGDRLLENRKGTFVDVSEEAGIYGSRIGYGLGVSISDVDGNRCPDIYVGNDFHEDDYLYLNNCDGTFTEDLRGAVGHTSLSSMGTDAADINNDGRPDIAVLDMLPDTESTRKTSDRPISWRLHTLYQRSGYYPQYGRNTLQLNQGNGQFSEIGVLAGIEATDWSWSPLFADLDMDGWKDLFVTNGIYRRPNDLDYLEYVSGQFLLDRGRQVRAEDTDVLEHMPRGGVPNYAFRNDSTGLRFTDVSTKWGLDEIGFSNGAAYGDLDNDGDLDLVINNIESPPGLYENRANERTDHRYLRVELKGDGKNTRGIGAKVTLYQGLTRQIQEMIPTRGYRSSVEQRLLFGLGNQKTIDSVSVVWPDQQVDVRTDIAASQTVTFRQSETMGTDSSPPQPSLEAPIFTDVTDVVDLPYSHEESNLPEFNRQPLLPRALSLEGPPLAVADVNGDGLDDLFVGGGERQAARLFIQQPEGDFLSESEETWKQDAIHEDVDATFFDANGDDELDLYVVSGGTELSDTTGTLRDRIYIGDGTCTFDRATDVLPAHMDGSGSSVAPGDYDRDGDVDLFVGRRFVPGRYGTIPKSYLLENDGSGHFTDVTDEVAPDLGDVGMVTDAVWADATGDDRLDLVVVGEWMPITLFSRVDGRFTDRTAAAGLAGTQGWWNTIKVVDPDRDGHVDLIAGNLGLNSTIRARSDEPVRLYVNDFDRDGSTEPILTRYRNGTSYPIAGRDRLAKQLDFIKDKFPTYESYGASTIEEIVPSRELASATVHKATTFASAYVDNAGQGTFTVRSLPLRAQFAPIYDVWTGDLSEDGNLDLVLGGNFFGVRPAQGRYDASFGTVLEGDGTGEWTALPPVSTNLYLDGQVRELQALRMGTGEVLLVAARSGAPLQIFRMKEGTTRLVEE